MMFHNLVNTAQFSYTARDFWKNGGQYTKAPIGSREYIDFWEEEERRCRDGYTVGGLWIPGRYYGFLNFSIMSKVPDKIALKAYEERKNGRGKISVRTAEKILEFPRFWEVQYEWFMFKHIAWHGGTFMGITSPGGKHIGCLKARGGGFSYMEAWDGVYNYNFIPGSKSYYFAGIEEYLTTDGVLNKVLPDLDWINKHIHEWKQNRQAVNTMSEMHWKASYYDSFGVEQGDMSEIMGVIINDPNKTRGKRGRKILFEEGGSFKNLKKALDISLGSIKDGDIYVGQQTVLGTGGEEGPGIEGLEDVFDSPEVFDMLEFPNVWEEGELAETTCGYFCPSYRVNNAAIDADGNVDFTVALESEKLTRARKKKSKDPKALDNYIAEYPWKPQEALKRVGNNPFRVSELNKQIRYVKNSPSIQALFRYGYMDRDRKGKAKFIPQPKKEAKPIETYPHKRDDELHGCVTMIEKPYETEKGVVPYKLYQVLVDTYAIEETSEKEETGTNESLYCIYVLKNYNNISAINEGLPVCWFRGRRDDLNDIHEIAVLLAEMYNTTIQGEIGGGGQGLVNYCRTEQKLHLLEKEPEMLDNKDHQSKGRQGSYLMAMPTAKKRLGITYVRDWHQEVRSIDEKGNKVRRLHRWLDIVGMMELAKYNGKRNADTLSCLVNGVIMLKENAYKESLEEPKDEEQDYFAREFYGDQQSSEEVVSLG
jgi:hypothetical protein